MKKENIIKFLDAMVEDIDQNKIDLYKKIIENSKIDNFNNYEEFFFGVLYPFDNFIEGFLKVNVSTNDNVIFIMKNSNFIENHFNKLIIDKEGTPYSSDKSRTIMNSLIHYYLTGEEIKFNYNGEYTYHLPETIFKTHDHIFKFYIGLKNLFYGNNKQYLEALKIILDI
jgi:hypothetical protein